eukprot:jgi/Tetstr1/444125/TSEL_032023.t1
MAKATKRTTKFLRKVAKGSASKRKRFTPRKGGAERDGGAAEERDAAEDEAPQAKKSVEEMSMDEFLDGGFDAVSDEEGEEEDGEDSGEEEEEEGEGEEDGEDEEGEGEDAGVAQVEADTDDEDVGEVGAQNAKLSSAISKHKQDLDALRERDPEFYAYLQATDKDLLAFGGSDDESGEEEEEEESDAEEKEAEEEQAGAESDEEEDAEPAGKRRADKAERVITTAVVENWCKQAKAGKIRSLRFLMQAYRSATHFGDGEEVDDVKIASSKCFNSIMLFVLKQVDAIFRGMLSMGEPADDAPGDAAKLPKNSRWKKVQPLVKSFLGNSLHLLGTTTDPTLVAFILRRVRASMPLLGACERLQKMYLKAVLGIFGSSDSKARIQAILFLRQGALLLPDPALDTILKGAYKQFTTNAKFVNAGSVPHISFMASCISELWGINADASYLHAFGFIRQLAVTMRAALNTKTKDAFLEVYCWQYINCLELWAKVLGAHAGDEGLRPLVYPVAQLLMGAVRLVPTPRYFPLRLRLLSALASLSTATGYFLPLAPLLLEVLNWAELSKKPAPGGQLPNLGLQLRISKRLLRSAVLQEEVVASVMEMLAAHLAQWANHVAFPEVSNTTAIALRRFVKGCAVERFRRSAKQVLDAVEKTAAAVVRRREATEFSPKDLAQVSAFMEAGDASGPKANALQRLAAELTEKGKQRRAMVAASAVEVDEDDDEEDGGGGEEEDGEGLEAPAGFGNGGSEEQESEEEEGGAEGVATPFKAAVPSYSNMASEDEVGEDELQAYELSDEDEDEDVFGAGVASKAKAKGGAGKKRGRGAPESNGKAKAKGKLAAKGHSPGGVKGKGKGKGDSGPKPGGKPGGNKGGNKKARK